MKNYLFKMRSSLYNGLALATISLLIVSCELNVQPTTPASNSTLLADKTGTGVTLFSGITPTAITNLPAYKIGAVAFTIAEKFAFVGTGYNVDPTTGAATPSKDFWRYDPNNDTWTQVADFGGQARVFAAAFSIKTKGYVGTGSGTSLFNDFWEYNFSTNTWAQKADFAGEARQGATGFSTSSAGYIGTGLGNFSYKKDIWQYAPSTNTWIQKADMPGKPRVFGGSFVIDGSGYVGAGFLDNSPLFDFWKYNPASNNWSQIATLGPGSMPGHSGFFSLGKKGYAGGNQEFWMYEPGLNAWTKIAAFPGEMYNGVGFSLLGLYGYIGSGGPNFPSNSFYRYSL